MVYCNRKPKTLYKNQIMKTFEDCKNEVAVKHHFKDWQDIKLSKILKQARFDVIMWLADEAAELYAAQFRIPAADNTKEMLHDIISWEKDLSEYESLEGIIRERYLIISRTNPPLPEIAAEYLKLKTRAEKLFEAITGDDAPQLYRISWLSTLIKECKKPVAFYAILQQCQGDADAVGTMLREVEGMVALIKQHLENK